MTIKFLIRIFVLLKKYKLHLQKKDYSEIKTLLYNLKADPENIKAEKICIYALKNLKSGDPVYIPMICLDIFKNIANDELIVKIKKIIPNLPILAGMNDYRKFYREFIHKYENSARGNKCNCTLFKKNLANPYDDHNLESFRKSKQADYAQIDYKKCNICQRRWKIETNYRYHTPSSTWKELK